MCSSDLIKKGKNEWSRRAAEKKRICLKKNVSLHKLIYMTVYDTLKKMFRKYLKKEEELE